MNRLRPEKMARLVDALLCGHSIRAAAKLAPCSKVTANSIKRALGPITCACGQDSNHRGWCWWRYRQSSVRQESMGRLHARSRLLSEYGAGICLLAARLSLAGTETESIARITGLSLPRTQRLLAALTPQRRENLIRQTRGREIG